MVFFLFTGDGDKLDPYNDLLAVCSLSVLLTVVAVPRLAHKSLVLPDRRVLLVGTLVFALEALYSNAFGSLGSHTWTIWDSLGFAVFLFSFGYVALQMIFESERRLLSIEKRTHDRSRDTDLDSSKRQSGNKKSAYCGRLSSDDSRSWRLL